MRVLLTFNDGNPGAAPLTRLLHHLGHDVHHLRFTGHQPVLTDPAYQRRAREVLARRLAEVEADAWIPMFEEAWFLAEEPPDLPSRLNAPERCVTLHRKRQAAAFNAQHDLPSVPTVVPDADTDEATLTALSGPLFVKEDDSRGGYGTTVFADARSLLRARPLETLTASVVQPWTPGDLWILQGVFDSGRLVDSEVLVKQSLWDDRQTVRYIPYHRAVDSPAAEALLERVGALTGWQGMLEFECLGEEEDLRILEYNPRFSNDFLHTVATGSSFGENTVRTYLHQPPVPRTGARRGVTRNEGISKRYLQRQLSTRPAALLDPRWVMRWATLERARRQTMAGLPDASPVPETDASLT